MLPDFISLASEVNINYYSHFFVIALLIGLSSLVSNNVWSLGRFICDSTFCEHPAKMQKNKRAERQSGLTDKTLFLR